MVTGVAGYSLQLGYDSAAL